MLSLLVLSGLVQAAGVPRSCPLKSQQIKLARECFSGDMRSGADFGTFLGTDETSKEDLNYCFNAFVFVHPKKAGEIQLQVLKDDPKAGLRIFNYAFAEPKGRKPASTPTVTFKNLQAQCFAHKPQTDKCSKGVFGFGSTDLPLTVELARAKAGYSVKGHALKPSDVALEPRSSGDVAQFDAWLLSVVKQRLLTSAPRRVGSRKPASNDQFRYCRMALEGFLHQKKIPDPFTPAERKLIESVR